jgi:DeoR/GlpR family transcriptional regulator of sugar metabolism
MIAEDRLEKILALLEEQSAVTVNELKDKLYVSAATVRRDLAELARRGMIERSFGGAVARTTPGYVKPKLDEESGKAYMNLAYTAAQIVPDHCTVFIGSGAAIAPMLPMLHGRAGLTVVTDSEYVANALCGNVERLICCGGRYIPSQGIFTGKQAAEMARRYRYEYAFFTADAVSLDGTMEDGCMEKIPVVNAVCSRAKNQVLICPRETIGKTAAYQLMELKNISTVITDGPELLMQIYHGTIIETQKVISKSE